MKDAILKDKVQLGCSELKLQKGDVMARPSILRG